jgi:hypothetical protein
MHVVCAICGQWIDTGVRAKHPRYDHNSPLTHVTDASPLLINADGTDLTATWVETMPKVSIYMEERGYQGKETVFICAIREPSMHWRQGEASAG